MNDKRSLLVAASCPAAVLAGSLALWVAAAAPSVVANTGANAIAISQLTSVAEKRDGAVLPLATTKDQSIVPSEDALASIAAEPIPIEASATLVQSEPVQLASADPSDSLAIPAL